MTFTNPTPLILPAMLIFVLLCAVGNAGCRVMAEDPVSVPQINFSEEPDAAWERLESMLKIAGRFRFDMPGDRPAATFHPQAHFARQWGLVLLPPGTAPNGTPETLTQFLAEKYGNHAPYDELISEFVTIQSPQAAGGYYQLSGSLPENYAGHLSRVALGIRIECAQCHDHPFND